jgi:AraC family transcriptional regulator
MRSAAVELRKKSQYHRARRPDTMPRDDRSMVLVPGRPRRETLEARFQRVLRAIVHIEDHLDADLSLLAVAKVAHYSPFHLQRIFAEAVGRSPAAVVRGLRLERAARDLASGSKPIAAIARACGYAELAPFYRAFRARLGATPAAWRRRAAAAERIRPPMPTSVRAWLNDPYPDGQLRYVPVAASSPRGRKRPAASIVELAPLRVAFIRRRAVPEAERDVHRALVAFATRRVPQEDLVMLRLRHDEDGGVPEPRLDHAVVIGPRRPGQGRIGARLVGGGSYLLATAEGGRQEVRRVRDWLRTTVAERFGCRVREGPVIEVVLDDPGDAVPPGRRLTDVLVPIERTGPPVRWYWRRRRPLQVRNPKS